MKKLIFVIAIGISINAHAISVEMSDFYTVANPFGNITDKHEALERSQMRYAAKHFEEYLQKGNHLIKASVARAVNGKSEKSLKGVFVGDTFYSKGELELADTSGDTCSADKNSTVKVIGFVKKFGLAIVQYRGENNERPRCLDRSILLVDLYNVDSNLANDPDNILAFQVQSLAERPLTKLKQWAKVTAQEIQTAAATGK